MAKLGVGREVDAMCTRCKMVLNHVIVAMVAQSARRVKCLTCGSEHNYKNPEAKKTVSRKKSGEETTSSRKSVKGADYTQLMKGRDISRTKKYKSTGHFGKDDIIDHALFGIGLVTAERDGKKIDVVFEDGPRVLLHNAEKT